ncbi:unnamed protein product, partial [Ixodes pacificus]
MCFLARLLCDTHRSTGFVVTVNLSRPKDRRTLTASAAMSTRSGLRATKRPQRWKPACSSCSMVAPNDESVRTCGSSAGGFTALPLALPLAMPPLLTASPDSGGGRSEIGEPGGDGVGE